MKAIAMTASGGPEVLELQDLPEPRLARDTDMLVRVKAAGVNPVDTKMRAKPTAYPAAAPLVLIAAWEALHDRVEVKPWHKVLVHAGAGGVAHVAIQLARIAGAEGCTTVGSGEKG